MKNNSIIFFSRILLLSLFAACGAQEQVQISSEAGKFSLSPQTEIKEIQKYQQKVVKIIAKEFPNSTEMKVCSGSLVAANLVLTAAHCVLKFISWDVSLKKYVNNGHLMVHGRYFQSNAHQQRMDIASRVVNVTVSHEIPSQFARVRDYAQDWALLELEVPLGQTLGWFGVWPLAVDDPKSKQNLELLGYPSEINNGKKLVSSTNCKIRSRPYLDLLLYHDCSSSIGVSGGPLLTVINDQHYIVGINVAETFKGEEESYQLEGEVVLANVAVSPYAFLSELKRLLKTAQ